MLDILTPKQRHYCMSSVRNRVGSSQGALGLEACYRVRSILSGKPDIIIPEARLAVFIDG